MTVEHAPQPWTGDAVVEVKQLVADIEALDGVLQVRNTWDDTTRTAYVSVVLDEFDWDVRMTVIELIDAVHRAHVHELGIEFDIVDRNHRPFEEFI